MELSASLRITVGAMVYDYPSNYVLPLFRLVIAQQVDDPSDVTQPR